MPRSQPDLAGALRATRGIVCAVGAGGKKSLLYHLAETLPGKVGLTATVQMARFPATLDAAKIVADSSELEQRVTEEADGTRVVAFARASQKPDRLAGLPPNLIDDIHRSAGFDVTLVKADGARMRLIKAPRPGEPVLPAATTTIVPIVSARVIGRRLTEEIAHRLDRISAITGLTAGDVVGPEHLAQLMVSPAGALQNIGDAVVSPLINMVDTAELAQAARTVAQTALDATRRFDRVVLASLRAPSTVVEVITANNR